jgi:transcription termination factor Rho
MNLAELKRKTIKELAALATDRNIEGAASMRRQELIFALLNAGSGSDTIEAEGVIEILPDGFGFLRAAEGNFLPGADDVYVSPSQIRRFNLRTGDTITGRVRPPKENERYFALLRVEQINHQPPERAVHSILFDNLTAIHPRERLRLEHEPGKRGSRVLDLLCPIGKGQRCLVTSPPGAGKTSLLQEIATAIGANHPEVKLMVLLIDERPEEVTEMRRLVRGDVVASTFDEPPARHVQVAEIVLERAKRVAEAGADAVLLIDSLTQLARAYNATCPPSGKLLAGGLDAAAVHKPKRAFGAARALDEGGSLTIVATAHTETGSELDDAILEQLQGTASCDVYLSAALRDARVYPCIDIARSQTRHETALTDPDMLARVGKLRRVLDPLGPVDAMRLLADKLAAWPTNAELLASLGPTGAS